MKHHSNTKRNAQTMASRFRRKGLNVTISKDTKKGYCVYTSRK